MSLILDGTNGLSDVDGSASTPAIRGTDTNTGIFFPAADTIAFSEGGVESMRIDSSGNVGIGVTPSAWATVTPAIELRNGVHFATLNTSTPLAYFGANSFYNGSNWIYKVSSQTAARYEINSGGNGSHAWFTAPSGTAGNAISFTQAMTLDSSGNLLVGTTSATGYRLTVNNNGNGGISVQQSSAGGYSLASNAVSLAGTYYHVQFLQAGTPVGNILSTGSTTSYNTTSDYRLKENVAPMTGALATVAQLKPVTYNWKVDGSDGQGFIAHELQAVVPDCVTGEKDAVDAEGNPQYQGIDTSFLVATLTAAIQEQQAIITDLKARLEVLEAK